MEIAKNRQRTASGELGVKLHKRQLNDVNINKKVRFESEWRSVWFSYVLCVRGLKSLKWLEVAFNLHERVGPKESLLGRVLPASFQAQPPTTGQTKAFNYC